MMPSNKDDFEFIRATINSIEMISVRAKKSLVSQIEIFEKVYNQRIIEAKDFIKFDIFLLSLFKTKNLENDFINEQNLEKYSAIVKLLFPIIDRSTTRNALNSIDAYTKLYEFYCTCEARIGRRIHKGTPLVFISDSLEALGYLNSSLRFLHYSFIEDVISFTMNKESKLDDHSIDQYFGRIGAPFRFKQSFGLNFEQIRKMFRGYATIVRFMRINFDDIGFYPELIYLFSDTFANRTPTLEFEDNHYLMNKTLLGRLLNLLGKGDGKLFEITCGYLLSCIPGCIVAIRRKSNSTYYDVVCNWHGVLTDFRADLSRYFICECKDSKQKVDFSIVAKFLTVLDSMKSNFGIIFSRHGLTGAGRSLFADRQILKSFQNKGVFVLSIDMKDINSLLMGENLVKILRLKYEQIRLDLTV